MILQHTHDHTIATTRQDYDVDIYLHTWVCVYIYIYIYILIVFATLRAHTHLCANARAYLRRPASTTVCVFFLLQVSKRVYTHVVSLYICEERRISCLTPTREYVYTFKYICHTITYAQPCTEWRFKTNLPWKRHANTYIDLQSEQCCGRTIGVARITQYLLVFL